MTTAACEGDDIEDDLYYTRLRQHRRIRLRRRVWRCLCLADEEELDTSPLRLGYE